MGRFVGFDPQLVRELAQHLDTVADSSVLLHNQLAQLLETTADDLAPLSVSESPELQSLVSTLNVPTGVPLPLPTVDTSMPVVYPWMLSGSSHAGGPMPGALAALLHGTAADMRARCDRVDEMNRATPPSYPLDANTLLADPPADLNAVPPPGSDAGQVAAWWQGLTEGRRQQYLVLRPEILQTLTGLPADVMDRARQNAYFKVPPYKTSSTDTSGGVKLTLGPFDIGEGFAFRTEQMSDNSYRVTMINNARAGVTLDSPDDGLELSAGVKLEVGDTWVFKDKAEADRLQDLIHQAYLLRQQELGPADQNPMGIASIKLQEVLEQLPPAKIHTATAATDGKFKISEGAYNGSVKLDSLVTLTRNELVPGRPTTTTSYDFKVEGTGTAGTDRNFSATAVTNGQVQVTRDARGGILNVTVLQTVDNKIQAGTKADAGVANGSWKTGATGTQVVATSVPIGADPGEQAAAQQWLDDPQGAPGHGAPLLKPMIPAAPPPPDASRFAQLAHERGQVSSVHYSGTATDLSVGGKLKLGRLGIGFEAEAAHRNEHSDGAQYLGAPDPVTGERHFVDVG